MFVYYLLTLISGFSALVFENLWFRVMGLTLGSGVWSSALVLSSFMTGLALGNGAAIRLDSRIRRPLRAYSAIELSIGITGLSLILLLPAMTGLAAGLFRGLLDSVWQLNLLRLTLSFILLVIPATAMGATLPVLMKHLAQRPEGFGEKLGGIYGTNTLGAVLGVIACELLFVPSFGISGAGAWAASLNFGAALIALWLSRSPSKAAPAARRTVRQPAGRPARRTVATVQILAAAFLSGAIFLAFEVACFRFQLLFFDSLSVNFAMMLALVLVGIALGGGVAAALFRRNIELSALLPATAWMAAVSLAISYSLFHVVLGPALRLSRLPAVFVTTGFLALPVSFFSGVLFTLLGQALHREGHTQSAATGFLTASNTLGAATGSLVTGFYLISRFGLEKCFFIFIVGYGVIGLVLFKTAGWPEVVRRPRPTLVAGCALALGLAVFPWGRMETHFLQAPISYMTRLGEKRVALKEGQSETLQYLRCDSLGRPDYYRLVVNSHTMAATNVRSLRYMRLLAHFPSILHPTPRRAALLCFGLGGTAKALTEDPRLTSIDVVDTSRDIIEMSPVVYPNASDNPLNDPRIRVHVEDGRFFLMGSQEGYDIITAEPPPPHYAGVANLYSREFFRLVARHLAPGGIVTYWLPVHDLKEREAQAIVAAFLDAFPEGSLWTGSGFEWMMVGVKPPYSQVAEEAFRTWWSLSPAGDRLRSIGLDDPESLGALFIADGIRLRSWLGETPALTDNWPRRIDLESPVDATDVASFMTLMNSPDAARNFASSPLIGSLWPERLRVQSLERFERQFAVNAVLSFPILRLADLQQIFDRHPQDALVIKAVFWRHNFDFDGIQKLLESEPSLEGEGLAEHRAQLALIAGAPKEAAEWLGRAQDARSTGLLTLRAYCLLRAGDPEGAMKLIRSRSPAGRPTLFNKKSPITNRQ